mmetsp:Transcript_27764/g.46677  ORF Transcript_27764/g.46677 Transcript_27764/m.46677 type:complete len:121 (-) Transcript_27764:565-927(-)
MIAQLEEEDTVSDISDSFHRAEIHFRTAAAIQAAVRGPQRRPTLGIIKEDGKRVKGPQQLMIQNLKKRIARQAAKIDKLKKEKKELEALDRAQKSLLKKARRDLEKKSQQKQQSQPKQKS